MKDTFVWLLVGLCVVFIWRLNDKDEIKDTEKPKVKTEQQVENPNETIIENKDNETIIKFNKKEYSVKLFTVSTVVFAFIVYPDGTVEIKPTN